jgi:deoxyribonuclease V
MAKIELKYQWALDEQARLLRLLEEKALPGNARYIGGADVSNSLFSKTGFAGFVVLDLANNLEVIDKAFIKEGMEFPYIPGLLGFREVPLLEKAYALLRIKPDITIVDSHGIAHPRGFGAAAHLGVVLGIPTIGCAKTILCGNYEDPAKEKGSKSSLVYKGKEVGAVLRTKNNVNPVFISRGNLVTLDDCINIIMRTVTKYRLPEPIRLAHILVNEERMGDS